jgi:hypothetical protein
VNFKRKAVTRREHEQRAFREKAAEWFAPVRGLLSERPKTRADCVGRTRPCPWVSCRWHLLVDVSASGNVRVNFPDLDLDEMPETCTLDVADRGGDTLEGVGEIMNLTRERVRQLEAELLTRFSASRLLRD